MTERPILFSGPMVRAILAGEKTVTRRVVTAGTSLVDGSGTTAEHFGHLALRAHDRSVVDPGPSPYLHVLCNNGCGYDVVHRVYPRIQAGDTLWVRETWRPAQVEGRAWYRADHDDDCAHEVRPAGARWRPSIFMPRWASRISLRVVSVRAERLHAITAEEVEREGVRPTGSGWLDTRPVAAFATLWDRINGKRAPWDINPWVWRIEFQRQET